MGNGIFHELYDVGRRYQYTKKELDEIYKNYLLDCRKRASKKRRRIKRIIIYRNHFNSIFGEVYKYIKNEVRCFRI